MERESTGTKYMATNYEGSQSPPRAVELRKKKKRWHPLQFYLTILLELVLEFIFHLFTVYHATISRS
jgi:hypothetical protein